MRCHATSHYLRSFAPLGVFRLLDLAERVTLVLVPRRVKRARRVRREHLLEVCAHRRRHLCVAVGDDKDVQRRDVSLALVLSPGRSASPQILLLHGQPRERALEHVRWLIVQWH